VTPEPEEPTNPDDGSEPEKPTTDKPPLPPDTADEAKIKNNRGKGNNDPKGYDPNNPSNLRGGEFGKLTKEEKQAYLNATDPGEVKPALSGAPTLDPSATTPTPNTQGGEKDKTVKEIKPIVQDEEKKDNPSEEKKEEKVANDNKPVKP
jgi:hypothetical protein